MRRLMVMLGPSGQYQICRQQQLSILVSMNEILSLDGVAASSVGEITLSSTAI
jgi:hypothetical protein